MSDKTKVPGKDMPSSPRMTDSRSSYRNNQSYRVHVIVKKGNSKPSVAELTPGSVFTPTSDESYVPVEVENPPQMLMNHLMKDDETLIQEAKGSQKDPYKADEWNLCTLEKDQTVYGCDISEGQSEFYTNTKTLDDCHWHRDAYWNKVQVKKHETRGYRNNITGYRLKYQIRVPFGQAKANIEYGPGSGEQYFINQTENGKQNNILLEPGSKIKLK